MSVPYTRDLIDGFPGRTTILIKLEKEVLEREEVLKT